MMKIRSFGDDKQIVVYTTDTLLSKKLKSMPECLQQILYMKKSGVVATDSYFLKEMKGNLEKEINVNRKGTKDTG